jgi:sortase (surface protein transpeptidase)
MKRRLRLVLLPVIASLTVLLSMAAGASAMSGAGGAHIRLASSLAATKTPTPKATATPSGNPGEVPVAISIPDANVDAKVETNTIVNGLMLDPSDSWTVSWYKEMGKAGATGDYYPNLVLAGHVDNWDVGPAVFQNLANLTAGSQIMVTGEKGDIFVYAVTSVEQVPADPSADQLQQLVAPPATGSVLTIITCGGSFNTATGHYESRNIVHANLVSEQKGATAPVKPTTAKDNSGPSTGLQLGDYVKSIDDGVNVRIQPSSGSGVAAELTKGEEVLLLGGAIQAEGYTWWPVVTKDNSATGWVASDFLQK